MRFRCASNQSLFLRVDVIVNSSTIVVVFSDAADMPPPLRIDNLSEVICNSAFSYGLVFPVLGSYYVSSITGGGPDNAFCCKTTRIR